MDKIKMSAIREQFPMYGDMSDEQLAIAVRKKYYPDIPSGKFYANIDFDTERARQQKALTDSMSTSEKFLAGMGKSFVDLGQSAQKVGAHVADFFSPRQQTLSGLVTDTKPQSRVAELQQQIDERERLSKPLMDTTAGTVGKFTGDLALTAVPGYRAQQAITKGVQAGATLLPKAAGAINAVAPYVGAMGSGAAVGAALSPEDMSGGALSGAAAGGAGELAGRGLSALWSGGKAVLEPLTEKGRERVLKRTFDRYATDPAKVRAAAANPEVLVPGVKPTLAEATMDPGIAQLQRGAAATSPDVASALAQSRGQQIAGYRSVLDDLAGNDGKREFYDAARDAAANQLYRKAEAEGLQMTGPLEQQMAALMKRPSIQTAMQQARNLAAEKGIDITGKEGSVQGLHYVKKAMDGMISEANRAGNGTMAGALRDTQRDLVDFLTQSSPAYGEAMTTFRQMSRPINQMDVAQALRDKAIPALSDLGDGSLARVNANSYANALRNADVTAKKATGMTGAKMSDVMDPAQMQSIEGIGKDMARYASAQELARVPGSPTAQYLGAQNIIRQFLGPLGLPQSAADSMLGRLTAGAMGLPFKLTQSQTEQMLARALTDPKVAAKIMATKDPKTVAEILRPYAAQTMVQATSD